MHKNHKQFIIEKECLINILHKYLEKMLIIMNNNILVKHLLLIQLDVINQAIMKLNKKLYQKKLDQL